MGDVALDPERHEVSSGATSVSLPLKEFELLELLLANAGRVLPRETLIDRVWGTDYVGDTKTLDVHVKRLRAKVEPDPSTPTRIVTIRGLGYKYDVPAGLTGGRAEGPAPARTMGSMSTPAGWRAATGRPSTGPARTPSTCRRSPGWPAPTCWWPPATPWSRSRWPTRSSSTSTPTTPAGRSSSTWPSRWRRSRWWRPFIGPALDRSVGGRRWMIVGVTAGRALVCFVMIDDLEGLLLFPEAFAVLAMGKAYAVSRSAIVPTVVRDDAELVEANSKLQLLSGLAVPLGRDPRRRSPSPSPAPRGCSCVAVVVYARRHAGRRCASRRPRSPPRPPPRRSRPSCTAPASGSPPRRWGWCGASSASSRSCCCSTCATTPTWQIGAVLAPQRRGRAGRLGGGARAPPRARRGADADARARRWPWPAASPRPGSAAWPAACCSPAVVAIVSTSGRLAFDSLVQRDAPDANRGRSFASFELRFQIVWVVGAVIPVVIRSRSRVGFLAIAGVAGFAAVHLRRRPARHPPRPAPPPDDPTPRPTPPPPIDTASSARPTTPLIRATDDRSGRGHGSSGQSER